MIRMLLAGAIFAAACGTPGGATGDDGGDDAPPTPDAPPPPPPKRVRFIAIGDTGKGNVDQRKVAIAMRDLCAAKGCDFVLMLGDNIYEAGVDSTTDPNWQLKFEMPYSDIALPFYVALGNHDYGGKLIIDVPGVGNQWERGKTEVEYTQVSTKWNMPATHYTFTWGHVGFIVLDTNSIVWNNRTHGDQAAWLPTAVMETQSKDWLFVAGHHPYRSNGTHGNAGNYDAPEIAGIPISNPLPITDGENLKDFFDDHVCGLGAQVYFAGHDHSRQWLDEPSKLCGTKMIISGAGASTTELRNRGNTALYEDATKPGFMYVDIDGNTFTGTFYDRDGNVDFTKTFTK
ncbi:MAG TPA: metallophosphoesterase [Kofleriaceae bacterium]|nr:metallophosphoesterase [Kofleriaceae bacterium]